MTKLSVSPTIAKPGDTLTVRVESYDGPSERVNLQINFVRVELERDHFAFGSGQEADLAPTFEVCVTVPQEAQIGPYVLAELHGLDIRSPGAPLSFSPPRPLIAKDQPLEGRAFYVGTPPQNRRVVEMIEDLHRQRIDRVQKQFDVGNVSHHLTAQVAFLYSGLLIHAQQHCQGYSIIPYGNGLTPASSIGAVNEFTAGTFGVSFSETTDQTNQYAQSKPLAAIVVHRVGAATLPAAVEGIRPLVDDVALALAFDRGHVPEPFAAVARSGTDMMMWLLHRPYTGNRLAPFGATETGAQIERLTGAMSRTPFSKLLLELYVQARGELDPMFQLFRFWAVLELLAKKAVPKGLAVADAQGDQIVEEGKVVKTDGAAGRVYKFLFDQGMGGSHGSYQDGSGTYSLVVEASHPTPPLDGAGLKITLWDAVRAFYAVRNGVAHDGRFGPDDAAAPGSRKAIATALLKSPYQDFFLNYFSELTKLSVLRTLGAETQPS